MTASALARTAYAPTTPNTIDPRRLETAAFSRVTQMLQKVANGDTLPVGALASAIHDNRRLWLTVATSVADEDNALPKDLRARLFYLAEFVDHHSGKVFSERASVQPLIDINKAIMMGLNQKAPDQ